MTRSLFAKASYNEQSCYEPSKYNNFNHKKTAKYNKYIFLRTKQKEYIYCANRDKKITDNICLRYAKSWKGQRMIKLKYEDEKLDIKTEGNLKTVEDDITGCIVAIVKGFKKALVSSGRISEENANNECRKIMTNAQEKIFRQKGGGNS